MDFYCDQVLSGRVTVERIVETDHVLAFHHTQPYWPVHIVVIPRRHIASLAALEPADLAIVQNMLAVAADLCRRVTAEHGGCRLSTNSGTYQTTKHLHFYIHYGARVRDECGKPIQDPAKVAEQFGQANLHKPV
jgi:histidine triad (HIT) family protein